MYFPVILVFFGAGLAEATSRFADYQQETGSVPNPGAHNITSHESTTLFSCMAECVADQQCYSFIHESAPRRCRIVKGLPIASTGNSPLIGNFFINKDKVCRAMGFNYSSVLNGCYHLDYKKVNFSISRSVCRSKNAELFIVDTIEKQRFSDHIVYNDGKRLKFYSIDGFKSEGNLRYSDGTEISNFFWAPGQPLGRSCIFLKPNENVDWFNHGCHQYGETARICFRGIMTI